MGRRSRIFRTVWIVILSLAAIGRPATVLQYSFDGPLGEEVPDGLVDLTGNYAATIVPGNDPQSTITFGTADPNYSPQGTSAEFSNDDWSNYAGDTFLIPDEGGIDFSVFDAFTVELIINPASSGSGRLRRVFSEYIHAYMYLDGSNTLHAIRKWGPGGWTENRTHLAVDDFPLETWSHVAMTWDADAVGDKFKLYVDGELVGSAAGTSTPTIDSSGGFAVGGYQREDSSTAQFFQGRIDEFRLCDVALEPDQFLNGDPWPRVRFSASDSTATENSGAAQIAVILNKPFPDTVTVDYAVTGGTALGGGTDYTLTAGTLMFEPNQTTPESISISITNDSLAEDDETIIVTLSNPVDANLGYLSEHTFSILDDDTTPVVEFESPQSANPENVTPAEITVVLSRTFKNSVTVGYAVSGGSATGGGVDYNLENGALTFDPYETSKGITIEVISDGLGEGDESIEVSLSNPVNAVLGGKDKHIYTILDGFINSIGMEFASIKAGTFAMGSEDGDFDEKPVHSVTIGQPFYMSVHEVTNAQYEQFDPSHALIDHRGFSHRPDEAVIFVSWRDANAFCTWLSEKEGLSYRLPAEAEWEYACRAGTTAEYFTGATLDSDYYNMRNQTNTTGPDPQPLDVGTALPNAFGLFDMHGNVEEWCYDWYGPYDSNDRTDPIQLNDTGVKVSRGGSHSTPVYFLRSANRMGTVPDDGHWLIGFRVVLGALPAADPLPAPPLQRYQTNVSQQIPPDISVGPDPDVPYFYGPRKYVHIPAELSGGPLYTQHNHVPGIVECPNGDLVAIWYSTIGERDRLLNVAGSRLRYGQDQWEEASVFWNAPDRNDHCPQLWLDENTNTIYHFNGLADAYSWSYLATVLRTSTDNGV
ncbi:MAG: SUMF1/EgtB/PvdO family nonheme iron enzyme, partial [Planctomycetota bacterium]